MFERFRFDAKRAREDDDTEQVDASDAHAPRRGEGAAPQGRRVRVKAEPQPEPTARTIVVHPPEEAVAVSTHKLSTGPTRRWQERWHAICVPCFEMCRQCDHYAERRLRLLIVGHNPSDHAWTSGYSYSNPTNRFWNLLRGSLAPLAWRGILPADAPLTEQNHLPHIYGVGMTSIGLEPGNDAASYTKETMARWRNDFFRRLRRHVQQVCITDHGESETSAPCALQHSPMLIAFSGKRQFSYLFSPPLGKVESYGRQTRLPSGWPRECLHDCEVWVLPSSSGRAAMTTQQRATPYQQLADRFHELPWPEPTIVKVEAKTE